MTSREFHDSEPPTPPSLPGSRRRKLDMPGVKATGYSAECCPAWDRGFAGMGPFQDSITRSHTVRESTLSSTGLRARRYDSKLMMLLIHKRTCYVVPIDTPCCFYRPGQVKPRLCSAGMYVEEQKMHGYTATKSVGKINTIEPRVGLGDRRHGRESHFLTHPSRER